MRVAEPRLWSKDFTVAIISAVFLSFVFYLLVTTMAGYAVLRFSASDSAAGLASSSFVLGALSARMFVGTVLDTLGRYRVLIIAFTLSAIACALYLPADSLWLLIAVRFAHGAVFGAGHTAIMAAVQDIIPASRRAEGTGYFGTSTTLAAALGPLIAIILVRDYGYHWLFIASLIFTILGLIAILFLRVPERAAAEREILSWRSFHPVRLFDPSGLRIGTAMLIAAVAYSSVMTFLATYTTSIGIAEAAPGFFVAFATASLVARLTLGRVQDRFGDNIVVYPLFAAFFAAMLLISVAPSLWTIITAGILGGIGFGTLMSSTQAITIRRAGPARVGVATSTYFFMLDIGFGLGPIVLGAIIAASSYTAMYAVAALLVGFSVVLYWLFHGRLTAPEAGEGLV